MTFRFLVSFAVGCAALAAPMAAQQIITMPVGTWATDITPDGSVVVGSYNYGDGFIWRWREDPAPTVILGGTIEAVSDDGTVAAGNIIDPIIGAQVAAIWTQATGWQGLGGFASGGNCPSHSTAYDISGDGTTVVGLAWVNGCQARGMRWTAATGMQELQNLASGTNRCSAISGDGSALGGFAQGNFDRTPAFWEPNTSGFVINPANLGEVTGFTENGSRSVGTFGFPGQNYYRAFLRIQQTGAMTNLGSLHFNWASQAEDLSEDGRTIVGFDYISLARQAWVYTSTDGLISLNDRLTALGVTGAPPLLVCRAVSDDGNVVVGGGQGGGGPFDGLAFIVEFSTASAQWANLGSGLAGTDGVPTLAGTGALTVGSATSVVLAHAKPGSPAAFVIGLSSIDAAFKQGVLVPFPDLLVSIPAVAPSGSIALAFPWPAGLPSGLSVYWQCLVSDPAAPAGVAMSGALKSTTP